MIFEWLQKYSHMYDKGIYIINWNTRNTKLNLIPSACIDIVSTYYDIPPEINKISPGD